MGIADNNPWSLILPALDESFLTVWLNYERKRKENYNAKKLDKLQTAAFSIPSRITLPSWHPDSLYSWWWLPHISVLLIGKSSSYQAGGGIGIQPLTIPLPWLLLDHFLPHSGAGFPRWACQKGPVTNFIRTCTEILSSLPSVVVGLFGYLIFVVQFEYGFFNHFRFSPGQSLTSLRWHEMLRDSLNTFTIHNVRLVCSFGISLKTVVHVVIPEALPGITAAALTSGRPLVRLLSILQDNPRLPALDWVNWIPVLTALSQSSDKQKPWLSTSGRSIVKEPFLMLPLYQLVLPPCSSSLSYSLTLARKLGTIYTRN